MHHVVQAAFMFEAWILRKLILIMFQDNSTIIYHGVLWARIPVAASRRHLRVWILAGIRSNIGAFINTYCILFWGLKIVVI